MRRQQQQQRQQQGLMDPPSSAAAAACLWAVLLALQLRQRLLLEDRHHGRHSAARRCEEGTMQSQHCENLHESLPQSLCHEHTSPGLPLDCPSLHHLQGSQGSSPHSRGRQHQCVVAVVVQGGRAKRPLHENGGQPAGGGGERVDDCGCVRGWLAGSSQQRWQSCLLSALIPRGTLWLRQPCHLAHGYLGRPRTGWGRSAGLPSRHRRPPVVHPPPPLYAAGQSSTRGCSRLSRGPAGSKAEEHTQPASQLAVGQEAQPCRDCIPSTR